MILDPSLTLDIFARYPVIQSRCGIRLLLPPNLHFLACFLNDTSPVTSNSTAIRNGVCGGEKRQRYRCAAKAMGVLVEAGVRQ